MSLACACVQDKHMSLWFFRQGCYKTLAVIAPYLSWSCTRISRTITLYTLQCAGNDLILVLAGLGAGTTTCSEHLISRAPGVWVEHIIEVRKHLVHIICTHTDIYSCLNTLKCKIFSEMDSTYRALLGRGWRLIWLRERISSLPYTDS